MLIFKQECEDGLTDLLLPAKSRTISYCVNVAPLEEGQKRFDVLKALAEAYNVEEDGLYPTKSILVSTVWNLNDDIFDKYETFLARSTPVNKPTNNNHQEDAIVGHITNSWAVDENGVEIDNNIPLDSLPDLFHIYNTAVIYTAFSDPKMIEQSAKLIAEIEAGTKFVSMEAYFKGFDYALRDSNGDMKILQRNEKTAFLTKHLRCYKGTGEFQNYKVGRLLRGIVFSGKGYVDKPANPDSIIFNESQKSMSFVSQEDLYELNCNKGVYIYQKPNMGDNQKMSKELETQVNELTVANEDLNKKIVETLETVASLTTKNEATELENKGLVEKLAELTIATETLNTENIELKAQAEQIPALKSAKEVAEQELAVVKAELNAQVVAQKVLDRKNKLMAAGYTDEEAVAKSALFASLNDEQFETLATELKEAKTSKAEMPCEEKEDKEDKEEEAKAEDEPTLSEIVEVAQSEEGVNPSVGVEIAPESTIAKLRGELAESLGKAFQNNKRNARKQLTK